jgi:PAS domain S-box-containing protein
MVQRRSPETLSLDTFEQAPIGISYMDRFGRVLHANSAFCKLLGLDTREIESKLITEITHEGDIAHNKAELERLWRGDIDVIDVEKRYVRADGRALWVRATTALVREEGGAPSCSVEFLRDISARKDLAAALLQNQQLLQAVMTDLPIAIRACDVEGRLFLHNPAAAQLFALKAPDDSTESTLDPHAVEMFLPDGRTRVPHQEWPLARALRGENVTNVELLIAQSGGAVRTTLGSASRLTGQNGECLGAVAITQDVTERKKLERELANAQKLESIGQLAAGIAHEINTPTQFIGDNIRFLQESVGEMLGVLDRLLNLGATEDAMISAKELAALFAIVDMSYLREEVPKAIVQSLDGVERIAKIVGAMKDFSHPATEKAPYDLNRAILSTITVATNEWKYVADVVTDLAADLPFVPVMPGAFNQVVLNILVNAAHAIAANATTVGTKGVITVSTRKHADWAEIQIKDSGCGMPQEVRERIFDPFFTTKGVGRGTGQGLAIAHDVIVKKHHGTITVETAPGMGTTFVLRLPLDATDAVAA